MGSKPDKVKRRFKWAAEPGSFAVAERSLTCQSLMGLLESMRRVGDPTQAHELLRSSASIPWEKCWCSPISADTAINIKRPTASVCRPVEW